MYKVTKDVTAWMKAAGSVWMKQLRVGDVIVVDVPGDACGLMQVHLKGRCEELTLAVREIDGHLQVI